MRLGPNRYGKSGIHVATLTRHGDRHDFSERVVEVRLVGDFDAVHLEGDNSTVLPTDTMARSVYALANEQPDEEIEAFALRYTAHLLEASPAATAAEVWVVEHPWDRVEIDGRPHPHAFTRAAYRRTAHAARDPEGVRLTAGLADLSMLKTAGSAFGGFLKDRYTLLPETEDRILATTIDADWRYATTDIDFPAEREAVRETIVRAFAEHDESRSMQHTLWVMGRAVLEAVPNVEEITFSLPNLHHVPVDLEPYGLENRGEVFVVTDKPSGRIEGTVRRSDGD